MTNETIAQLVRTRLDELGLGVREAARKAEPVILAADISDLQLGKRVNISAAKQQGLAIVLQVPVDRVRAAIHTSLTSHPLELPGRLNVLAPPMRAALVEIGDALLRLQDEHGVSPGRSDQTAGKTARRQGVGTRRR